jgi:hypothetical protein
MDLVPAPSGEDSLKTPVVEVEAVDMDQLAMSAEERALEDIPSTYETDSDDSDDWDTLSNADDAIQILRDDQIRDGLGM